MKRDCEGEALARSITASFDSTKPLSDASRNGSLAAESQKLQQLEQQREQKTLKEAEERQRAEERKQRTRIGERKKKREKSFARGNRTEGLCTLLEPEKSREATIRGAEKGTRKNKTGRVEVAGGWGEPAVRPSA